MRIPSTCCGVVGLKTTFGRIPTSGVQPLAPSLDTIGPMARDVRDCAVSQVDEVAYRQLGSELVVAGNDVDARKVEIAARDDHGRHGCGCLSDRRRGVSSAHESQAVEPQIHEAFHEGLVGAAVQSAIGEEHFQIMLLQNRVHPFEAVDEPWVAQVVEKHSHDVRSALAEATCAEVGAVTQLANGLLDRLAFLVAD